MPQCTRTREQEASKQISRKEEVKKQGSTLGDSAMHATRNAGKKENKPQECLRTRKQVNGKETSKEGTKEPLVHLRKKGSKQVSKLQ